MTTNQFSEKLSHWLTLRTLTARPKTKAFYADVIEIIRERWPYGNPSADEITQAQLAAFADSLKELCPSRWNTMVSVLRFITPKAKDIKRKRPRKREFYPPTQLLFEQFLEDIDKNPRTKAGLTVRFLTLTGLRKGEAFGLKWENVLEHYIRVPAELCKSGIERLIPKLPGLEDVLQQLRKMDNGDFVLPRACPRTVIECTSRRIFGKQWSIHCFRHLFATRCIEMGVPITVVALWMGHQDKGVTLTESYVHLVDEQMRREASKVNILTKPVPLNVEPLKPAQHVYLMPTLTHFTVVNA